MLKTSVIRRLRYNLTIWSTRTPSLYYALRRLTGRMNDRCVTAASDIVIEGFPRSANSSTAHAFIDRQPEDIKVAHHLHHVAQLLRGIELNLPCVALIREPRSAILSMKSLVAEAAEREGGDKNVEPFEDTIKAWLTFYEALEPHLDRVVIAPFSEATKSVETVITNVNRKFGTQFVTEFPDGKEARTLGYHAKPNPLRNRIKETLEAELRTLEQESPTFRSDLERANRLYDKYLEIHASRAQ